MENETSKKKKLTKFRIILGSILIILAIILVVKTLLREPPLPDGAIITVMCTKCKAEMNVRVRDISDPKYVCPKCEGKLGQLYKCFDCEYEFPVVRENFKKEDIQGKEKYEILEMIKNQTRCPNCLSQKTRPILK